jgi:hypothetical protein
VLFFGAPQPSGCTLIEVLFNAKAVTPFLKTACDANTFQSGRRYRCPAAETLIDAVPLAVFSGRSDRTLTAKFVKKASITPGSGL